jgi:GNAT superfamily N-acetyltransferase
MFIRPAERRDRKQIRQLIQHRETITQTELEVAMQVLDEALRHPERGDYYVFCAIDDSGSIAGYICFGPIPLTDDCYDLYWIVVDKSFAKRGMGTGLLAFMEGFLAGKGARQLYVDTESGPAYEAARSFYEKNGFHEVCVLDDFYRKGASKLIFMKEVMQVVKRKEENGHAAENTQSYRPGVS